MLRGRRIAVESDAASYSREPSQFGGSLVGSRLRPPQLHVQVVRRSALLRVLDASHAPLVVAASPGGFGKTIALVQWTAADPRPVGWLQADGADNDPLLFLRYLAATIESVADIDARVEEWLQLAPPPITTRILPAVVAAVGAAAPFVLVIDDTHLIENDLCWQLLGVVADALPSGARLCLCGRDEPRLPLPRLRAQGRVIEIGPRELALSRDETSELLHMQGMEPDPNTVESVWRLTEGWPVAVYLAALAGREVNAPDWLAGIRGHRGDIAGYLANEVFERESPRMRRFLLDTSILERLSPNVCRAVTGDPGAGELLRGLSRRSLFVSALDDTDEWFRYHHLFAEFLRGELAGDDEAVSRALHARAAEWFEAHDARDEAVRHWLAAGESARAGAIVCRMHLDFAHGTPQGTIRRWLDMFTDEQIRADDALTVVAGFWGPVTGDTPRARGWAVAAVRLLPGDGLWPGTNVPVRAIHAILRALYAPDGITGMRADAELAVRLSDGAHPAEHVTAVVMLAQACWFGGDRAAAERHLREGVEEGGAQVLAHLAALGHQVLTLTDDGRWAEARPVMAAATMRFEQAGLTWEPDLIVPLLAQTRIESHDGDPAASTHIALLAEFAARVPPYLALLADALTGEMLAEAGDLPAAARRLRSGLAQLAAYPDAGILGPRIERLRELIEQRTIGDHLTRAERHVLELLPTQLTLKEIAERLGVSPETVRSHVASLYRKLDVHVRTEAVTRARELRLLDPV